MDEKDLAVKIIGLKKRYRLGVIGGSSLQGDIQSWIARKRGKEDPNAKFGKKQYDKNEVFWALKGIDLEIKKGERLGIIGHNGAGKSTMLKIFSRVTAPTEGKIYIDGKVSSMLEVGTGFHEELTGRENIYLNGAILGMTKAEVDSKIDQIIEFSECKKFIDTPVKRYSSGMTVKLAFAVAAHLDADILVMDEVLAVGDVKFQQKCLGKMSDVSQDEGKTVLYVSHNMNTIRQLCDRCIVLNHGEIVFDGDVEEAIAIYSEINLADKSAALDLRDAKRYQLYNFNRSISYDSIEFLDRDLNIFNEGEVATAKIGISSEIFLEHAKLRIGFRDSLDRLLGSSLCLDLGTIHEGKNFFTVDFDFSGFVEDTYKTEMVIFSTNDFGSTKDYDIVLDGFCFDIVRKQDVQWNALKWGTIRLKDIIRKR